MSLDPQRLLLNAPETALVVIDVQDKLLAAMDTDVQASLVRSCRILVQGMQALQVPVVVTEQYPKGLGPTVAPLRELLEGASPALAKVEFDGCAAPGFLEGLRAHGARQVVLCGMEAHICVLQTAAGLLREGFGVWVAQDAIASRSEESYRAATHLLEQLGAVVAPSEAILFLLLRKAGTPEFKAVSPLIK